MTHSTTINTKDFKIENTTNKTLIENEKEIDNKTKGIWRKVVEYIKYIFEGVKRIILFPKRYISFSDAFFISIPTSIKNLFYGKKPQEMKIGSKDEVLEVLRYKAAAAAVHSLDETWVTPLGYKFQNIQDLNVEGLEQGLTSGVEQKQYCFFDKQTSLKAMICSNDKEVIITFGALGSGDTEIKNPRDQQSLTTKQYLEIAENLVGFVPFVYQEAEELFQKIKNLDVFKGKKITLNGQCLGGSLAQYVGLKNHVETKCFNCVPLGVGLQEGLDVTNADQYITNISIQTDFVSDNKYVGWFGNFLRFICVKTPQNFGSRFSVPTAYTKMTETHAYAFGSLMNYLGYDVRNKPESLKPEDLKPEDLKKAKK